LWMSTPREWRSARLKIKPRQSAGGTSLLFPVKDKGKREKKVISLPRQG
jgi:hypothetical protein